MLRCESGALRVRAVHGRTVIGHCVAVYGSILMRFAIFLHCALSLAVQCIVIGPVCEFVCLCVCMFVCLWVCYHDNSKFHASILTKLGLHVKAVTISS